MAHENPGAGEHREQLLPVAGACLAGYLIILTASYFIGNLIYQIP